MLYSPLSFLGGILKMLMNVPAVGRRVVHLVFVSTKVYCHKDTKTIELFFTIAL